MRIYVKSPGSRTINLVLPTRLILNNITATIGTKQVNRYINKSTQEEIHLSTTEVRKFIKLVHQLKKKYPDWCIVDVESADGEVVKIKL